MEDPTFPLPNIPNDVIVEILTWLPVKALLRFKCVCKSWRALISSPQFIKSHLENSKLDQNLTLQRLLMQSRDRGNLKQISANSMLHKPVLEAFDLSSPFRPCRNLDVLGSCNGLLCFAVEFPVAGNANEFHGRELVLWNPSTRIRKQLPHFELNPHPAAEDVYTTKYGFGYDKSSDDYKVVRFFRGRVGSSGPKMLLQVYSLRNDQWKHPKPLGIRSLMMAAPDPAVLVNGKVYWMGAQRDVPHHDRSFVYCFDLETEEHKILRFPNGFNFGVMGNRWLGECGGSLRLMCFQGDGSEMWSMDGRKWARVGVPNVEGVWGLCKRVLYVMNSPVFVLSVGSIAIFDVEGCSIRYHKISNSGDFRVQCAYIENLVSPLG